MLRFPLGDRGDDAADEALDPELASLFERAANIPAPDLTAVARARGRLFEEIANREAGAAGGHHWRRWFLGAAGGGTAWATILGAAAAHKAVVAVVGAGLLLGGAVAADTAGIVDTGVVDSIAETVGLAGSDSDDDPLVGSTGADDEDDSAAADGGGDAEGEEKPEDRFADRDDLPEQSSVQNAAAESDLVPGGLHSVIHDDGSFNIRGALIAVDPVGGTIDVEVATANGVSEVVTLTLNDSTRINVPGRGEANNEDRGRPEDTGPLEDAGRPEDAGPPEDSGRSENPGSPDDSGRPEGTGPPEGRGNDQSSDEGEDDDGGEDEGDEPLDAEPSDGPGNSGNNGNTGGNGNNGDNGSGTGRNGDNGAASSIGGPALGSTLLAIRSAGEVTADVAVAPEQSADDEDAEGEDDGEEPDPILERLALAAHAGRGVIVQGVCSVESGAGGDDGGGAAADKDGDSHLHVQLGRECTVSSVTVIGGGLNGVKGPEDEGGNAEGDDPEEGDHPEEGDDAEDESSENDDLDADATTGRGNSGTGRAGGSNR